VMHMTGVGAPRDFVKACMWFSIAGKGDPDAVSNKNYLLKRMTPEEIVQSENLAQEWLQIRKQEKRN
jgi:TPR repeat protein